MRVVVIGHRGLIGSAFTAHLRSLGVEVTGVDRASYASAAGRHADVVVNAGGSPDKRLAEQRPLQAFVANVESVLRGIVDFPCGLYVHISTASVYEHPDDPSRNRESEPIDPLALPPYGALKYLGELVARRFAARWLILRLGSVIGPGLRRNAIFDLLERRTLFVSPGSALCYVDSRAVARAVWELRDQAGEIYNLAGRGTVRLSDVAAELGVALPPALWELPAERLEVNVEKALQRVDLPRTEDAVRELVRQRRAGLVSVGAPATRARSGRAARGD